MTDITIEQREIAERNWRAQDYLDRKKELKQYKHAAFAYFIAIWIMLGLAVYMALK